MSKHTLFEVRDGIAEITLNRPERMNAFTWQMGFEVNEHLVRCDEDDSVRAVVVTGAGRAYCAGADLGRAGGTFDGSDRTERERAAKARPRTIAPWEVRKPIIAAINGPAVGVGLTMPLQYDLRIAAVDAKLGFVFVRRGVNPELASTWILPRLVGVARAADLLLSGRIFTGEEAAQIGLVNEALPAEDVLPRAREIAREIATNSAPVSVAITKQMIWEHLGVGDPKIAMKREAAVLGQLGRGPDAREGVVAWLEKREARWSMRPTADLPEPGPTERSRSD
ncbi:MAG: enoyl-CoA hydratase-related protein [Proteobacteria bacterium]|nr:enoyl-CoA hydratase-related protein [Pseudomonadota bacterium]